MILVCPAQNILLVLSYPWLRLHKPQINWVHYKVGSWSLRCHSVCDQLFRSVDVLLPQRLQTSLWCPHTTTILPHYCAVSLSTGAPLPVCHLYSLSCPEREAMEYHFTEFLTAGISRPSTSPLRVGFFSLEKTLTLHRLSRLTHIMVKNKYPAGQPALRSCHCIAASTSWVNKSGCRHGPFRWLWSHASWYLL